MAFGVELFSDEKNLVLMNPRWSDDVQKRVQHAVDEHVLRSHVWIASSGTESFRPGAIKMVGISKRAFLVAADSVCKTLSITNKDIYFNTLPLFHVGGLSTMARTFASNCTHIQADERQKWNPVAVCEQLQSLKVTVTSLVPTQIFDIVAQSIKAPKSLRFVFIGGGSLSEELYASAQKLGWDLVPTYGMTETAAMIAYQQRSPRYTLFPHITGCRTNGDGRLQIQSEALFTGYIFISENGQSEFVDPKENGWFTSGDKAKVLENQLELEGRETELVKIKGESVSLLDMNMKFENFCLRKNFFNKSVVIAFPDARDGYLLCAVSEGVLTSEFISEFNENQLPYERISRAVSFEKLPLTALGKIDIAATRRLL